MADTLSKNFCSLCGLPFDRFGTQNDVIKTSLASKIVEESGLLDMLNISVAPLRKELVFICISCRTVFSNYTVAKKEAITLLTKPVEKNERVPFVPYLKRKSLHTNSGVPCKVQKLESASTEKIQCGKSDDSCERKASGDVKTETSCTGSDEAFQPEKTHSSVKLQNLRSDAIKFLEQGMYRSALRKLWITSKKFRSSLLSFIAALLKKETKNLLAHDTLFTKELENTVLDEISWDPTFTILSSVAPTTLQVLYALLGVDLNTV
ncbi:hypothetical protein SK128_005495 [Halocaridina rubra]|uniref:Uncharacterized protein n=1 Tax=Halocaridina rubra TaxID=373956 RepID=A0AAN8X1P7_HALRR